MAQNVVKFISIDFENRHNELAVKKKKLENEVGNVEEDYRRIIKHVENYR